jgi:transposase
VKAPVVAMPRKTFRRLTVDEKGALMGLRASGHSFTSIAKILEADRRTIARNFKKIMATKSYANAPVSGRPRKTSKREDKSIVREVQRDRYITADDIRKNQGLERISQWTVRRRIVEGSDFKSYWQKKKPYVSKKNQKIRVQWCKDHLDWTLDQWRSVLWSDESPFVFRFAQKVRVWRTDEEKHSPIACKGTVKHDGKVNVWGCFAAHGVGDLYLVDGILRKEHSMFLSSKTTFIHLQ